MRLIVALPVADTQVLTDLRQRVFDLLLIRRTAQAGC